MNHYLLHVSAQLERPLLSWQKNLFTRNIVVVTVSNLQEAIRYTRVYSVLLILLEINQVETALADLEGIREARQGESLPPLVGWMETHPEAQVLGGLAEAGLSDVMAVDDPDAFIFWRLDLLRCLSELKHFEQSRVSVGELAQKTRMHLHDLSQPLSAIQGRLQLMAAKCPIEDVNARTFQDLVRLSLDITQKLMELQHLHRQYS